MDSVDKYVTSVNSAANSIGLSIGLDNCIKYVNDDASISIVSNTGSSLARKDICENDFCLKVSDDIISKGAICVDPNYYTVKTGEWQTHTIPNSVPISIGNAIKVKNTESIIKKFNLFKKIRKFLNNY